MKLTKPLTSNSINNGMGGDSWDLLATVSHGAWTHLEHWQLLRDITDGQLGTHRLTVLMGSPAGFASFRYPHDNAGKRAKGGLRDDSRSSPWVYRKGTGGRILDGNGSKVIPVPVGSGR